MTRRAFVPSLPDQLESRVVLSSSGITYTLNGSTQIHDIVLTSQPPVISTTTGPASTISTSPGVIRITAHPTITVRPNSEFAATDTSPATLRAERRALLLARRLAQSLGQGPLVRIQIHANPELLALLAHSKITLGHGQNPQGVSISLH